MIILFSSVIFFILGFLSGYLAERRQVIEYKQKVEQVIKKFTDPQAATPGIYQIGDAQKIKDAQDPERKNKEAVAKALEIHGQMYH